MSTIETACLEASKVNKFDDAALAYLVQQMGVVKKLVWYAFMSRPDFKGINSKF